MDSTKPPDTAHNNMHFPPAPSPAPSLTRNSISKSWPPVTVIGVSERLVGDSVGQLNACTTVFKSSRLQEYLLLGSILAFQVAIMHNIQHFAPTVTHRRHRDGHLQVVKRTYFE